jgi:hypothetical protein
MRLRRRRPAEEQAAGEDSFLDVVANLVGIFVILIMVIGVRAKDAAVEQLAAPPAEDLQKSLVERAAARQELKGVDTSVREIQTRAQQMEGVIAARRGERHQLNVLMAAARLELDERRNRLDEVAREEVEVSSELRSLEKQLEETTAQRELLESEKRPTMTLEHLPTPMAKTVFGSEEHYRLERGRLTYVPLNELTERLRADAPQRAARLMQVPELTETIGPIQGFHMRYTMHRRSVGTNTPNGTLVRQVAELKQFELVPLADDLGEPLAEALESGSQFRQSLDTFKPGATIVTVWTYPDSYAEFRELKRWLYDRGFACAARPLPAGQLISGSPQGSRSAAQ